MSSPAHGRAGPSCRSRPPPGSSPPRPTGASCMTTGGCRATVVYEVVNFIIKRYTVWEMTYTFFACAARSTHVGVRPTCRRWCHSMHCVPLLSSVVRALCANRAVLRSKVVGRAGRRRGYQMRSYDGRAQPRAVWATPRPVERAQASDGADDREERQAFFRSRPCLYELPLQRA